MDLANGLHRKINVCSTPLLEQILYSGYPYPLITLLAPLQPLFYVNSFTTKFINAHHLSFTLYHIRLDMLQTVNHTQNNKVHVHFFSISPHGSAAACLAEVWDWSFRGRWCGQISRNTFILLILSIYLLFCHVLMFVQLLLSLWDNWKQENPEEVLGKLMKRKRRLVGERWFSKAA